MRLTTKGRYAVTAMLDIALHAEDGPVSVQDIAARQDISSSYLEQIVGRLKRDGLLSSHRGPGGGYRLGRKPEDINVSAVVTAVGEGVDVTRCSGRADCQEGHMCLTHDLWVDLSAQIDGFQPLRCFEFHASDGQRQQTSCAPQLVKRMIGNLLETAAQSHSSFQSVYFFP